MLEESKYLGKSMAAARAKRRPGRGEFVQRNGDPRTVFDADYDKIFYSSAFRRLTHVAQVVPAGDGHLLHNRLTHSSKVAAVGRDIANRLWAKANKTHDFVDIFKEFGGLNPTVVAAGALAHDIGHPPFGHAGEQALQQCLAAFPGEVDSFEGNAQSLRNVVRFSIGGDSAPGLNLSSATMNAFQKYPWKYEDAPFKEDEPGRKFGVYSDAEYDLRQHLDARSYLPQRLGKRRCIEAQVVDMADDITFAVHDMEDFIRCNLIPAARMRVGGGLEETRDIHREAKKILLNQVANNHWLLGQATPAKTEIDEDALSKAWQTIQSSMPSFDGGPYRATERHRGDLRNFVTYMVSFLLNHVKVSEEFGADMDDDGAMVLALLRAVMRVLVIRSPQMSQSQYGQSAVVTRLFEAWNTALIGTRPQYDLLPMRMISYARSVHTVHADHGEIPAPLRLRIVADCIAQLTDQEAEDTDKELFGLERRPLVSPFTL